MKIGIRGDTLAALMALSHSEHLPPWELVHNLILEKSKLKADMASLNEERNKAAS